MTLGLGTGSTATLAVEAIGRRVRSGELKDVLGVPTSKATAELAGRLGIPLTDLDQRPKLDLTIDGADEVDPGLNLIKGRGGALLREKIVARSSGKNVIVVDETKLVEALGRSAPLPVEVVPFGWRTHIPALEELGARVTLRRNAAGHPYVTDEGHFVLDCRFQAGIADAHALDAAIRARAGIVETGFFLGMVDELIVGGTAGVNVRSRRRE
jgi:ribose 5-phosphate isomerase A